MFIIIHSYSFVSLVVPAFARNLYEVDGPRFAVSNCDLQPSGAEPSRLRKQRLPPGLSQVREPRGTKTNELFRSEFGQNSWNRKKTTKNHFIEVACDPKYKKGP